MTEGCSIQCKFCGIQGIREKPGNYKYLSIADASVIAERIANAVEEDGWNPRIEFAMHGEPTVNPNAAAIVGVFRRALPKTSMLMLTNGSGLAGGDTTAKIDALFDAGLNTLGIEEYGHTKFHTRIRDKYKGRVVAHHYPRDKNANPHTRQKHRSERIVYIADIFTARTGTHSSINTHCGVGSPPPDSPLKSACAKPFRELSIRWNGEVAICCNDWRGTYQCGTVLEVPIQEIWYGRRFRIARAYLYRGQRGAIDACSKCDEKSYRVGLIPDAMGKYNYPPPSQFGKFTVKQAERQGPLTEPVLRPWEKEVESD